MTRQLRSDAVRNRALLVQAARDCFHTEGIEIALDTIARRAGVGNATLYRHFPTREDLYEAVFADIAERIAGVLERYPSDDTSSGADGFETLHRFLIDMFTASPASAELGRLADARIEVSPTLQQVVVDVRAVLGRLLERAQEQGQVRPDVDLEDVGLLVGSVSPLMAATEAEAPNLWRRHLALVLDSLRPDGRGPLPDPGVTMEQRIRLARSAARQRNRAAPPVSDQRSVES